MAEVQNESEPHIEEDADRRRHVRVDMRLKARFLTSDGVERPCIVANISAGGALLRAVSPPAENEKVVLYVDEVGRFEGKVVRSGKHTFAIDYRSRRAKMQRTADALTVTLNNQQQRIRGQRLDRRSPLRIKPDDAPAFVIFENGTSQSCSILDISLTGASIEIDPRPPLGAQITIGKMSAKVVRRHERGVGVVFSGPAARLDDALNEATAAAPASDHGANFAGSFGRKGFGA
ncbi:MAG: PilZ domain-containing protein [Amphiplicatus sp.]